MKRTSLRASAGFVFAACAVVFAASSCKKNDDLVPYGQANAPATGSPAGPQITTKGPVKVKVTPPTGGAPAGPVSCAGKPDKTLEAGQKLRGGFGGVQVGAPDGARVIVRTTKSVEYFTLAEEPLAYFFVAHKPPKKLFDVAYDSIERCLEHAGGYIKMLKMNDASLAGVEYKSWWSKLDESGKAAAKDAFQKYVDSAFTP